MNKNIPLIIITFLALLAGAVYLFGGHTPIQQACTLEAKVCPDGSTVGRTGPDCAFAPCPGEQETQDVDSSWEVAVDSASGVTLRHPRDFGTTHIEPVDWPPMAQVLDEPLVCVEAGETDARAGKTELRAINGATYCVTTITEGAAGSIYTQYAYARETEEKTVILTFSTRAAQCGNYDEPQKAACERERAAFAVDPIINRVFNTLMLTR